MSRAFFSLALVLTVVSLAVGKDEPAKPAGISIEDVRQSPDDDALLNKHLGERFSQIGDLLDKSPDAAEKALGELEADLGKLEPTAAKAKTLLTRAKSSAKFYRDAIDLARVSLADLEKSLTAKPDDSVVLLKWFRKVSQDIGGSARTEPAAAEKKLAAAKEFAGKIAAAAQDEATKTSVASFDRSWGQLEKAVEGGKKLAALIGKDAAPLVAQAWVNGTPLAAEDLKGKVVLLDFWAIWCGPCIATFPHLREWNEKYASKGLVMVGMTRYYKYQWNEDEERAVRAEGEVAPEAEHEMLKKFAAHHHLTHRFAIQEDQELSNYYAVSGIPHVVVIDQQGKVRMIRVGSGDKNAEDIGGLLAELLAPAAGE